MVAEVEDGGGRPGAGLEAGGAPWGGWTREGVLFVVLDEWGAPVGG